jgi:hypothetical protein
METDESGFYTDGARRSSGSAGAGSSGSLRDVEGLSPRAQEVLESLGYTDVDQVLALSAMPELREHLFEAIGEDPDDIFGSLREQVPEAMLMAMEAPAGGSFGLGVLPPDDEVERMISEAATPVAMEAVAALPPSVNHASRMNPVLQQGPRGTCVGFAMTAMHEFYRRQSGNAQDLSEQFLYHQTKLIDGSPNTCGTWCVKAASWFQSAATRQSGRITMRIGNEPLTGGHAMCFIGYQDDRNAPGGGFFILRNSWGTTWASQSPYGAGNGTIPYAYIAQEGWEAVTHPLPRRQIRPPWIRQEERTDGDANEATVVVDAPPGVSVLVRG